MNQFDYCISNPAFNIANDGNIAGTGGNTTLYRTATRNDFDNRLRDGGTLINVTLKGIIPDLVSGYFKNYQVNWIYLMDDIKVWPYNTCVFSITKKPRTSDPIIIGGMAAKIYTIDPAVNFDFVYYSGSNNGMNPKFGEGKPNKVIRQLPGKNRDAVAYDYTDEIVPAGPKFAFYVLESKKSYTVTDEPVYGGTICYVPFETLAEAEKLKLFVEKNPVFKEYINRMNIRGHAFGLRNVRKFDVNQIVTGLEIPHEWNLTEDDLKPQVDLPNDITEDRNKVKAMGEVFTPTALVNDILDIAQEFDPNMLNGTFIDSMCGDGQFLVGLRDRGVSLDRIYGIELDSENAQTCRKRLGSDEDHIVCADSLSSRLTTR